MLLCSLSINERDVIDKALPFRSRARLSYEIIDKVEEGYRSPLRALLPVDEMITTIDDAEISAPGGGNSHSTRLKQFRNDCTKLTPCLRARGSTSSPQKARSGRLSSSFPAPCPASDPLVKVTSLRLRRLQRFQMGFWWRGQSQKPESRFHQGRIHRLRYLRHSNPGLALSQPHREEERHQR